LSILILNLKKKSLKGVQIKCWSNLVEFERADAESRKYLLRSGEIGIIISQQSAPTTESTGGIIDHRLQCNPRRRLTLQAPNYIAILLYNNTNSNSTTDTNHAKYKHETLSSKQQSLFWFRWICCSCSVYYCQLLSMDNAPLRPSANASKRSGGSEYQAGGSTSVGSKLDEYILKVRLYPFLSLDIIGIVMIIVISVGYYHTSLYLRTITVGS
jgi:hypothetical protein